MVREKGRKVVFGDELVSTEVKETDRVQWAPRTIQFGANVIANDNGFAFQAAA